VEALIVMLASEPRIVNKFAAAMHFSHNSAPPLSFVRFLVLLVLFANWFDLALWRDTLPF
jgi:hypothetical protein